MHNKFEHLTSDQRKMSESISSYFCLNFMIRSIPHPNSSTKKEQDIFEIFSFLFCMRKFVKKFKNRNPSFE